MVITQKSWTSKKIRVNLDTRPMKEAVKTTHFPIPTPQELRHNFAGSDRYSVVDLNHAFHQFALDEESKELFVFYTPWGLYKYNTLVMGVNMVTGGLRTKPSTVLLMERPVRGVTKRIIYQVCVGLNQRLPLLLRTEWRKLLLMPRSTSLVSKLPHMTSLPWRQLPKTHT